MALGDPSPAPDAVPTRVEPHTAINIPSSDETSSGVLATQMMMKPAN
ncbi:hypothetical protein J2857_005261 [Neorhizobium galegae]|nr:hypothetical protein [Neorhizobium galegae]